MKKKWIVFCLSLLAMASCKTGVFTAEYGKEDVAYVCFVSSDKMAGKDVQVFVDNKTQFTAHVQKAKQSTEKHNGKLISIKPGKRTMKVVYEGTVVY